MCCIFNAFSLLNCYLMLRDVCFSVLSPQHFFLLLFNFNAWYCCNKFSFFFMFSLQLLFVALYPLKATFVQSPSPSFSHSFLIFLLKRCQSAFVTLDTHVGFVILHDKILFVYDRLLDSNVGQIQYFFYY